MVSAWEEQNRGHERRRLQLKPSPARQVATLSGVYRLVARVWPALFYRPTRSVTLVANTTDTAAPWLQRTTLPTPACHSQLSHDHVYGPAVAASTHLLLPPGVADTHSLHLVVGLLGVYWGVLGVCFEGVFRMCWRVVVAVLLSV